MKTAGFTILCGLLGGAAFGQQLPGSAPPLFPPEKAASSLAPGPGGSRAQAGPLRMKPLGAAAASSGESCKTYTFNGLPDKTQIPSFDGISAPGWVSGISVADGGTAQFIDAPDDDSTVAVFLGGGTNTINFAAPVESVQYYYATAYATTLAAYDSNGNLITSENIPPNWDGNPNGYEVWTQIPALQGAGDEIASVTIQSAAALSNFLGIDQLNVCGQITIAAVEMTQAIQQYQTISDLEASLENTGEPPVPIIAGKPGVMRIYTIPPMDLRAVNMELAIGAIGFDQTKQAILQPNCAPTQQRSHANMCQSTDFYFTPPSGSWSATITVSDPNTGATAQVETLDFESRTTNSLFVKGAGVCPYLEPGGSWVDCTASSDLLPLTGLLSQLAPTFNVLPLAPDNVVRLDYSTFKAPPQGLPEGTNLPTYWWKRVDSELRHR